MKMGDHMQEIIDVADNLCHGNQEEIIKLLSCVLMECMVNVGSTEFAVTAGAIRFHASLAQS